MAPPVEQEPDEVVQAAGEVDVVAVLGLEANIDDLKEVLDGTDFCEDLQTFHLARLYCKSATPRPSKR